MHPPHCPLTSASLLLAICRGAAEPSAWERFVLSYGPVIFAWCRRRGLAEHAAEDVTQRVWALLHEKLPAFEYDPGRGTFRGWLFTVTKNEVVSFLRDEARRRCLPLGEIDPEAEGDLVDQLVERELLDTALEHARAISSQEDWQVFELLVLHAIPAAEVASRFGVKAADVYRAKYRVSKTLAAEIKRLEGAADGP